MIYLTVKIIWLLLKLKYNCNKMKTMNIIMLNSLNCNNIKKNRNSMKQYWLIKIAEMMKIWDLSKTWSMLKDIKGIQLNSWGWRLKWRESSLRLISKEWEQMMNLKSQSIISMKMILIESLMSIRDNKKLMRLIKEGNNNYKRNQKWWRERLNNRN